MDYPENQERYSQDNNKQQEQYLPEQTDEQPKKRWIRRRRQHKEEKFEIEPIFLHTEDDGPLVPIITDSISLLNAATIDEPDTATMDDPGMVTMDEPGTVTTDEPGMVTMNEPSMVTIDELDMVTIDEPDMVTIGEPADLSYINVIRNNAITEPLQSKFDEIPMPPQADFIIQRRKRRRDVRRVIFILMIVILASASAFIYFDRDQIYPLLKASQGRTEVIETPSPSDTTFPIPSASATSDSATPAPTTLPNGPTSTATSTQQVPAWQTIFQEPIPDCNNPGGTTWDHLHADNSNVIKCTSQGLLIQQGQTYYPEDDLVAISSGYDSQHLQVKVHAHFNNVNSNNYDGTDATIVVQAPAYPQGSQCAGLYFQIRPNGSWRLQSLDSSCTFNTVKSGTVGASADYDMMAQVQNGQFSGFINGSQVVSLSDTLSSGVTGLMVINFAWPTAEVYYTNLALLQWS
jgi:hypothetical protein